MMGVMGPWMAAQLAVSPVSRLVFLTPRAWLKLFYDTTSLLVVTTPAWLWRNDQPEEALLKMSLLMVFAYVLYLVVLLLIAFQIQSQKTERM